MAHGRGITDSTLSKRVHAMPRSIPICDALKSFTGVYRNTFDQYCQYIYLNPSSTAPDRKDYETFLYWLEVHSPFPYGEHNNSLICVVSGVIAGKSVSAAQAVDLDTKAASVVTGQTYVNMKLKKNHRVTNISGHKNQITVHGVELLFISVTCVIKNSSEMEGYFLHELAKQPPS